MFCEPHVIVMIVLFFLLLCISAFVSGSETALFSLSPADLDRAHEKKGRSDEAILKLLEDSDYTLASILITNHLVNICIVILSANIISETTTFRSAAWEFVFTTVIVTFLLLLFGEIMPKVFASYNPLGFARRGARAVLFLRKATRPLSYLLVRSSSRLNNLAAKNRDNISLDELSNAIDITETQSREEKRMLSGIVSFASTEVEQIMVPRLDITAIERSATFERVKEIIISSGFSRIPVYEENIDNIVGILYVKDVLPHLDAEAGFDWTTLLRKAYYVPEHKKINDLLEEFQSNKVHMAIVVDEYGSTLGLLSLEDILEEIVGEISDESDTTTSFYTKLGEGQYIFEGKTHLGDFERILGLPEELFNDVKGNAETVAGLMLEIKRNFLKKGESVTCHGLQFTVISIDGRRIGKVKVVRNEEPLD